MRAHELSLAVSESEAFAAWHGGYQEQGSTIYIQRLNDDGELIDDPVAVSDGSWLAYEPDIIATEDRLILAWYEREPKGVALRAQIAAVTSEGDLIWAMPLSANRGKARNPVVRETSEGISVAWIELPEGAGADDNPAIWLQVFDPEGQSLRGPVKIGEANQDTWNLNAGVSPEGDFYLAYDASLGTIAHELQLVQIGRADASSFTLSADDGHPSLYPDIQFSSSGQMAMTWFDEKDGNEEVYLRVSAPGEVPFGSARLIETRVTKTKGSSIGAYLNWNGDALGLAWSDDTPGQREVYGQIFNPDGIPQTEIIQLSENPEQSSIPSIRAWQHGFLVAWNNYVLEDGPGHGRVTSSTAETKYIAAD